VTVVSGRGDSGQWAWWQWSVGMVTVISGRGDVISGHGDSDQWAWWQWLVGVVTVISGRGDSGQAHNGCGCGWSNSLGADKVFG